MERERKGGRESKSKTDWRTYKQNNKDTQREEAKRAKIDGKSVQKGCVWGGGGGRRSRHKEFWLKKSKMGRGRIPKGKMLEKEGEIDRQTDRQTYRRTDRQRREVVGYKKAEWQG